MAEKIHGLGVRREKGWLYYLDDRGDVSRTRMSRGRKGGGGAEKVALAGVQKEKGYMYFIDKDGDIGRALLNRSGRTKA